MYVGPSQDKGSVAGAVFVVQEVQAEIATLPPGAQEKMTKLYPFQRQGVEFVVSRHGRAMLAVSPPDGRVGLEALVAQ
jgi:hypothetical protein